MGFSDVHIRYFIGYVHHFCLQDTIQSTLLLCLLCQAMLLPMPLGALLLTLRSGFTVAEAKLFCLCWALGIAESDRAAKIVDQIQVKISSPGGIAEGVQVPILRSS